MKGLGVVLAARVEHAYGLYKLSLWNATAIVAHGDAQVVLHVYLYAVARIHLKLIDRVVYHLLEQHIYAVFGQ